LRTRGVVKIVRAVEDLPRTEYPRASAYDSAWLISLDMGPNPLWLLEDPLGTVTADEPQRPGPLVAQGGEELLHGVAAAALGAHTTRPLKW